MTNGYIFLLLYNMIYYDYIINIRGGLNPKFYGTLHDNFMKVTIKHNIIWICTYKI